MLNKIYHADFSESVQPRKFNKMLSISISYYGKTKSFLNWLKKKYISRISIINYHFHLKKEVNIGQTKGYKPKWGTRFEEKVHEGWELLQKYSNFMEDLFQKGDAEKSSNASQGNK